ncbi:MAG: hypothetical protein DRP45_10330 [Candidatus Zixiibacteriota bacterium]|nr:MAG: hypothetical protein DRP45_10330 [candidate division Zixibacteria bacterium]
MSTLTLKDYLSAWYKSKTFTAKRTIRDKAKSAWAKLIGLSLALTITAIGAYLTYLDYTKPWYQFW